jgi:L-histidine N-alpha-methyltransferase
MLGTTRMDASKPKIGPIFKPHFVDGLGVTNNHRGELLEALGKETVSLPAKFFYDALGSRLFEAITELDEYYPPRVEATILKQSAQDMAAALPQNPLLIDLGAGNCAKAESLFSWLKPSGYLAVDISLDHLKGHLIALSERYMSLPLAAWGLDFFEGLELSPSLSNWLQAYALFNKPWVLFYPGSSIGNFSAAESHNLLKSFHRFCRQSAQFDQSGLLVGVDCPKSIQILEAAYDDALGVTAAFNRNILRNVNRIAGTNFDPSTWEHLALFNPDESRIEMYLKSRCDQTVNWVGGSRIFLEEELIHTENSYKWTDQDFTTLLQSSGFATTLRWTDSQQWFSLYWSSCASCSNP